MPTSRPSPAPSSPRSGAPSRPTPTRVGKGVTAFAAGLLDGGVAPTLKHFPGLGRATATTDEAAVTIDADAAGLAPGLVPYRRAIAAGVVPLVMVSNAAYTRVRGRPAAWSPRVLALLQGLGFGGPPSPTRSRRSRRRTACRSPEAAIRAAAAGVDLLLFVGPERSTDAAYDALLAAARSGRLSRASARAERGPHRRAGRDLRGLSSLAVSEPEDLATTAALYGRSAVRIARRRRRLGREERLVFVVGSPRSGTTFTGSALGSLPGFVDLDEVQPWKAAIPGLLDRPDDVGRAAPAGILERVRRLGLAPGLRGVEQTPETSFVLAAALRAYPEAVAVHVMRDGRDVVTSLLERGWLSAERGRGRRRPTAVRRPRPLLGRAGPRGRSSPRSPTRRVPRGPGAATSPRRCAVPERTVEVRYEQLVADPARAAAPVAEALGVDAGAVADAFSAVHDRSAGRWRRDLTPEQVADVEREAGEALVALGYELS